MKHYCIVNCQNPIFTDKIKRYGYTLIAVEESSNISKPVSLHADMLYLKTDKNHLFISDCQTNNITALKNIGFTINTVNLSPGYKTECGLNMVVTDDMILHNPKTGVDICLSQKNKHIVYTRQGYTKCSTIVIGNNNFITEDESIFYALQKSGKNCLLIQKGYVKLKGYNYGFIGGASVYLEKENLLLFFGNITKHCNYYDIINFCSDIGVKIDFISEIELTDIGGAICLF